MLLFVAALAGIVYSDNSGKCGELGLRGSLLSSSPKLANCVVNEKYRYDDVAIVVGNTANSPMLNPLSITEAGQKASIEQYLTNSQPDSVTVFSVASGASSSVKNESSSNEVNSIEDLKDNFSAMLEKINDAIFQAPTADGADYLGTIRKAARHTLARADKKALVIVIGSGLSDKGELNTADGDFFASSPCSGPDFATLDKKIETIKNNFVENSLLGTQIVWYGLGQTVAPQSQLGFYDEYLEYIYKGLFEYLGATISFNNTELSGESIQDTKGHTVRITPIAGAITIVAGNESVLGFVVNTANFRDRNAAKAELAKTIPFCPNTKIEVEGYVAKECNRPVNQALAQSRADATRDLILEIANETSSPTPQINAVGRGKGPHNECVNGHFIESIANTNRFTSIKVSQER